MFHFVKFCLYFVILLYCIFLFKREQPVRLTLLEITFFFFDLSNLYYKRLDKVVELSILIILMIFNLSKHVQTCPNLSKHVLYACYVCHPIWALFVLYVCHPICLWMLLKEWFAFNIKDSKRANQAKKAKGHNSNKPKVSGLKVDKIIKEQNSKEAKIQTCPHLSKLVKICQNMSKFVKTCQNLSNLGKALENWVNFGKILNLHINFSENFDFF